MGEYETERHRWWKLTWILLMTIAKTTEAISPTPIMMTQHVLSYISSVSFPPHENKENWMSFFHLQMLGRRGQCSNRWDLTAFGSFSPLIITFSDKNASLFCQTKSLSKVEIDRPPTQWKRHLPARAIAIFPAISHCTGVPRLSAKANVCWRKMRLCVISPPTKCSVLPRHSTMQTKIKH